MSENVSRPGELNHAPGQLPDGGAGATASAIGASSSPQCAALLSPAQLATMRRHIADGGPLGNGNARALLSTLDAMTQRALEAALTVESWAPCHEKGARAALVQTLRAYLAPEPLQEGAPCPSTSPSTDPEAEAMAVLGVLGTNPGIAAADEVGRRTFAEWATRHPAADLAGLG